MDIKAFFLQWFTLTQKFQSVCKGEILCCSRYWQQVILVFVHIFGTITLVYVLKLDSLLIFLYSQCLRLAVISQWIFWCKVFATFCNVRLQTADVHAVSYYISSVTASAFQFPLSLDISVWRMLPLLAKDVLLFSQSLGDFTAWVLSRLAVFIFL